jgi:hypothetical protein
VVRSFGLRTDWLRQLEDVGRNAVGLFLVLADYPHASNLKWAISIFICGVKPLPERNSFSLFSAFVLPDGALRNFKVIEELVLRGTILLQNQRDVSCLANINWVLVCGHWFRPRANERQNLPRRSSRLAYCGILWPPRSFTIAIPRCQRNARFKARRRTRRERLRAPFC